LLKISIHARAKEGAEKKHLLAIGLTSAAKAELILWH
jgi:hypothetical protein